MSPEAHRRLVELDATSREAREFYEYAAAVLPASPLRERCLHLARTKAELVALLALRLQGGRHARHARVPTPRRHGRIGTEYARARAGLAARESAIVSSELLRIEAAVTRGCETQAAGSDDADCRRAMAWVLPVLACCLEQAQAGVDAPLPD